MSGGEWLTTAPHPWKKAHRCGQDQNQVGWRVHYVPTAGGAALCGLRPAHGWGVDLFIERPCARCYNAAVKAGIEIPDAQREEHETFTRVRALLRGAS